MPDGLSSVADIVTEARSAGRAYLIDPEAFSLCESIGIGTPEWVFVEHGSDRVVDLKRFTGNRVVIKIVAPTLLHKSDVGGIKVVANDAKSVRDAIAELETRFAEHDPAGCLIVEFIEHDTVPGTELLLSARWNREFGTVITFGFGGVYANLLADNSGDEAGTAFCSPLLSSRGEILRSVEATLAGRMATQPFRGSAAPCTAAALDETIARLCAFAREHMPHDVAELEINPLVASARGLVAVDALVRVGAPERPRPARPVAKVEQLLQPQSIAIVGVSRELNPGRIILTNVLEAGFDPAGLFVVKPGCDEIDGCRCVPDLEALPHPVDLCVLSIAAAGIPAALEAIIRGKLAESVIVIPGGIGEVAGTGDRALHVERILASSRTTEWQGPVVNGGNCLGVRSVPGSYNTLFIPAHKLGFDSGKVAPLAIVAQSGALIAARASKLHGLNPRYVVSLGNQLDLTHGDYLKYFESDPGVSVVACYAEGFRDGDGLEFFQTARRMTSAGRTVLLYRAGRTEAGARASASHTAAIAGDNRVTTALARQAGVIVVDTLSDFEHLTRMACLLHDRTIAGLRLGAISNAGYEAVAVADNLGRFTLAEFGHDTRARLMEILRSAALEGIVSVSNTFDVTPIMSDAPFAESVEAIIEDPGVDVVVVGCVPLTGAMNTLARDPAHDENAEDPDSVGHRLGQILARSAKPAVAVVDAGSAYDTLEAVIAGYGIPTFRTIDTALRTLSTYCFGRIARNRQPDSSLKG